nr:outer membrane beta-barrel protein [uncultured Lacibacter sp.]
MKQSILSLLGLVVCLGLNAQSDTTKPQSADTIKVGNMIIIKKHDGKEKKVEKDDKDDDDDDDGVSVEIKKRKEYKKSNISTNWMILDLGFSNVNDQTNYASPEAQAFFPGGTKEQLDLRNGRSINVNVWFFMQRINIIQHVVNLKYGLGVELNNYSFEKSVRYNNDPVTTISIDNNIKYRKNKLAADYLTVPVMLDFNFAPKRKRGYGFSAGVSAGYLYASRQKMKSEENGKEKNRSNFNLEPWKLSAIGELNLGVMRLYGSYALNNLHKNGLEQTPYNIGIRLSSW